jgi:hypothetical protein
MEAKLFIVDVLFQVQLVLIVINADHSPFDDVLAVHVYVFVSSFGGMSNGMLEVFEGFCFVVVVELGGV